MLDLFWLTSVTNKTEEKRGDSVPAILGSANKPESVFSHDREVDLSLSKDSAPGLQHYINRGKPHRVDLLTHPKVHGPLTTHTNQCAGRLRSSSSQTGAIPVST